VNSFLCMPELLSGKQRDRQYVLPSYCGALVLFKWIRTLGLRNFLKDCLPLFFVYFENSGNYLLPFEVSI
jgi:hypothetical protein